MALEISQVVGTMIPVYNVSENRGGENTVTVGACHVESLSVLFYLFFY